MQIADRCYYKKGGVKGANAMIEVGASIAEHQLCIISPHHGPIHHPSFIFHLLWNHTPTPTRSSRHSIPFFLRST